VAGAEVSHRTYWHNPLVVASSVIVLFFSAQIIGALIAAPLIQHVSSDNIQLLVYVAANLLVTLGLVLIAKSVLPFTWSAIGLKKPHFKSLLTVVPAFIVYFIASTLFTILATKFIPGFNVEQAQDVGFKNLAQPSDLIAAFVSLVVVTPIFEELIFRGLLFKGFKKRFSFWPSAIAASLIFALAHLQWNVAVDTFALSLLLCYLVEKSGSIIPSILLHALKNGLAFTLLFIIK
jgi:membrane protease YdiL (CAAX protease family)